MSTSEVALRGVRRTSKVHYSTTKFGLHYYLLVSPQISSSADTLLNAVWIGPSILFFKITCYVHILQCAWR